MGIKETLEIIITATDKASGKLETVGSALGDLGKGVATAGAAITGATAAVGLGALKLATDAAPLVQVQGAFDGLTASFEGGSAAMIKAMQEGSAGMVSNAELMRSYNSAAQLVGTTFANQLPDAMGYLGKVAGATGEDMGFMIDSLVKGVGRISPMILDNLGIQVTLADATANASAQFGKQADELSKTELQAGMTNVVLEKLAENTKNMPELAGSATAGFEGLKATFTNVKDELGVALLPLFQSLIDILKPMIDEFLPKLVGFIEGLTDRFSNMSPAGQKAVLGLIGMVAAIGPLLIALGGIISFAGKVATGISAIQGIATLVGPALSGVGAVITGTVLPALGAVVAAVGPVLLVIAAAAAAVGLLVMAWERDWGGIRTTWTANWENLKIITDHYMMEIGGKIEQGLNGVTQYFKFVMEEGDTLNDWLMDIPQWAQPIAKFAGDSIVGMQSLTEYFKFVIDEGDTLNDWLTGIPQWAQPIAKFAGDSIVNIKALVEYFRFVISEGDTLNDWLMDLPEKWREPIVRATNTIIGLIDNIKAAFNIDWTELGKRIIDGIVNGIRNGIQWVIDAAADVARAAIDAAKSLLGINSPSSVMSNIGSNMMAGWAQGIQSAQTAPVNSAASSYSNLTQSYLSSAAPQVNISVGSIDSRVDVDELAWKVIDRIKQITGG